MFRFFFRRRPDDTVEATPETQRETLLRALGEVNEITAAMDPKPAVTIDPATGSISLILPEQMPDEALALPAPDIDPETNTEETTEDSSDPAPDTVEKPDS